MIIVSQIFPSSDQLKYFITYIKLHLRNYYDQRINIIHDIFILTINVVQSLCHNINIYMIYPYLKSILYKVYAMISILYKLLICNEIINIECKLLKLIFPTNHIMLKLSQLGTVLLPSSLQKMSRHTLQSPSQMININSRDCPIFGAKEGVCIVRIP